MAASEEFRIEAVEAWAVEPKAEVKNCGIFEKFHQNLLKFFFRSEQ